MVQSAQYLFKACLNCGHVEDASARFCPSCGACAWVPTAPPLTSFQGGHPAAQQQDFAYAGGVQAPVPVWQHMPGQMGTPTLVLPENMPKTTPPEMARSLTQLSDRNVPAFAHVRRVPPEVIRQNQVELAKMMVLLARERLFLLFHFAVFASVNIIGFVLALKCYNEFIGDEMSKIMMACTPFWIFNAVALTCLIPIKGTKRQIARLKEQIAHQRFKIDFGHLI